MKKYRNTRGETLTQTAHEEQKEENRATALAAVTAICRTIFSEHKYKKLPYFDWILIHHLLSTPVSYYRTRRRLKPTGPCPRLGLEGRHTEPCFQSRKSVKIAVSNLRSSRLPPGAGIASWSTALVGGADNAPVEADGRRRCSGTSPTLLSGSR
jgi:hypothetical protein